MDIASKRGLIIAACVAFAIVSRPPIARPQVPATETRLWALELETVPSYKQLILHGTEIPQAASVTFVDAKTVAVTYRFVSDSSALSATDVVSFFDADSGLCQDVLQWSTRDRFPADRDFIRLLPTRNGEFLVVVGRSIRRFSTSHKERNTRALPWDGSGSWEWVVRVSPNGQTAHLKRFGPGDNEDHWISAETLQDQIVTAAPFYDYRYQVGNGFVVYTGATYPQIRVHTSTGEDRMLCPECKCLGCVAGIAGDRIFFGGFPKGTGVVTKTDGTVLLRKVFASNKQGIDQVSAARDSSEVAFYMSTLQVGILGGFRKLSRVVVLNTSTLQELRRFDFEEPGEIEGSGHKFLWPVVAISPDGTKLALFWRITSSDKHDRLEVFPVARR